MKRSILNLTYGIVGLLLLVGSIVLLCLYGSSKLVAFSSVSGSVLMLLSWAFFYQDKKDKMQHCPEQTILKKDLLKCVNVECAIPFERILTNFVTLSKLDDTIVAENDYLSWNSGSFAEIRVSRLNNENWVCIYWERASWMMTDSIMESIFKSNDIQMPLGFRKMKPHGIAIYSQGNLQIYPSILKDEFAGDFLETVLSQGDEFEQWVKDYYGEE